MHMEHAMNIARLILELLAVLPNVAQEIDSAVQEMHRDDPTGTKAVKAAQTAASIASAAAKVVSAATSKE